MVPERGRLAEAAVAEAANEGLVQSVDAHVGAQVAAGVEASVADDAAHAAGGGDSGDGGGGGGGRGAQGRAVTGVGVIWEEKDELKCASDGCCCPEVDHNICNIKLLVTSNSYQ